MKTSIKNLLLLPALIAGLGLIPAGGVTAQTFTNLHIFTGSDGANPYAGLISSSNKLFGTTHGGGLGYGTVYAVNSDGTGFTNLHSFTATSGPSPYTNSDGAYPYAGLILSGNTLYGTASFGGSSGGGTVYAVNTDGTGFTNLHSFTASPVGTNSDGGYPNAGLILSGNTLYGTAVYAGSSGGGTVFKLNTDGTGFTNLHNFTAAPGPDHINSDGANPLAGLILSGNTLYGTANYGGSSGNGTVFAVNTDGTAFTNLYSFTAISGPFPSTNSDGAYPNAGLILSGNTLYGTAYNGGSSGGGTMFKVNINGSGFTNLHSFTATPASPLTNSDGWHPLAELVLSGNTLYGTTSEGGSSGKGTVFAVNTDGTSFTNLHSFTGGSDGAYPSAGLILSDNILYGTASGGGGGSGVGTVFSLSLGSVSAPPPQLTIISSGADVILTWPTNAAGFTLQFTTNLVSPVVWSTNSLPPVVVNGQNTVTNPISGTQQFFRLSQ